MRRMTIATRLREAYAMREEAERNILSGVEQAVDAGMSWSEIGDCLNVTKQSAHRKYSKQLPDHLRNKHRKPKPQ